MASRKFQSAPAPGKARTRSAFRPIVRERVVELLETAAQFPITLLIAGAGAGKSVALGQWLERQPPQSVIRFDVKSDATPAIYDFAASFARAIERHTSGASPAVASATEAARNSPVPEIDLANWLAVQLRRYNGTVVIDDLHTATDLTPSISKLVEHLISETNTHIRWLIASRNPGELPIASWIAYGLTQVPIEDPDLAFTDEEARHAADACDAQIADAELSALQYVTGGWAAGLAFALVSAMRVSDLQQITASTRVMSYAFLAEQVYGQLSSAEKEFLLRTCVYEDLNPAHASAYGIPGLEQHIEQIAKKVTFVSTGAEGAFRYHDLFRDFLQRELRRSTFFESAWTAAARAYEELAEYALALGAYAQLRNTGEIIRVLEAHGFALNERGRRSSVIRALESVDSAVLRSRPHLLALYADAESNAGNYDRSDAAYEEAVALTAHAQDRAEIAIHYARDLMQRLKRGGVALLEPLLNEVLSPSTRAQMLGVLATAYWHIGEPAKASRAIESALEAATLTFDRPLEGQLHHQSAFLSFYQGDLKTSERHAKRALEVAQSQGLPNLAARVQSILYLISFEQDDVMQALWWLRQMERAAADAGDTSLIFSALVASYDLEVERASDDVLDKLDRELERFDAVRFPRAGHALAPSFAMRAAWNRQFADSVRFIEGTESEQLGPARKALRASEIALYAAAGHNRNQAETAYQYASGQLNREDTIVARSDKRYAKTIAYLALTALILGKRSRANRLIQELEKMAHRLSARYKALVKAVRGLYLHAETGNLEGVQDAFDALRQTGFGGIARMMESLPTPALGEATSFAGLTRTELQILRTMSEFTSTKDIAARLKRSPNTISWHLKAIMKKLQCSSRHEAIARARRAGVI